MNSLELPVPLTMTPIEASGTSIPSSRTFDVASALNLPSLKPFSTSCLSSLLVVCVMKGSRNLLDIL